MTATARLTNSQISPSEISPSEITSLTLPEPPSSNRWHRSVTIKGRARVIISAAARKYQAQVVNLAFALGVRRPHEGPIRVSIDWHRSRRAGDLDKRISIALDALQGLLFVNDSQIVELRARRFDSPANPRIVVTVTPVGAVQESLLENADG